jgi:hypothetical protein
VLVAGWELEFNWEELGFENVEVEVEVPVAVFTLEEVVVEREFEDIAYRYTPRIKDAAIIGITATATSLLPFDNLGYLSQRGKARGAISFLGIQAMFSPIERRRRELFSHHYMQMFQMLAVGGRNKNKTTSTDWRIEAAVGNETQVKRLKGMIRGNVDF